MSIVVEKISQPTNNEERITITIYDNPTCHEEIINERNSKNL
jgi:hypothetical protein